MKRVSGGRIVLVTLLAGYLIAYLCVSRQGYRWADEHGAKGFFYAVPENTRRWEILNGACEVLFWPLNQVDQLLGTGRSPSCPPLFDLSRSTRVAPLRKLPGS